MKIHEISDLQKTNQAGRLQEEGNCAAVQMLFKPFAKRNSLALQSVAQETQFSCPVDFIKEI